MSYDPADPEVVKAKAVFGTGPYYYRDGTNHIIQTATIDGVPDLTKLITADEFFVAKRAADSAALEAERDFQAQQLRVAQAAAAYDAAPEGQKESAAAEVLGLTVEQLLADLPVLTESVPV